LFFFIYQLAIFTYSLPASCRCQKKHIEPIYKCLYLMKYLSIKYPINLLANILIECFAYG